MISELEKCLCENRILRSGGAASRGERAGGRVRDGCPGFATIACMPLFVKADEPKVDAPLSKTPLPVNPMLLLGLMVSTVPPGAVHVPALTVTLLVAAEQPTPAVTTTS